MKKLILLLSIIALFCQNSFAQTGGINFQGVARNATGAVLANQKINLKFSILKTTETGTVEYTETKEATTNAQGIFAVVVGEVNATSFAAVDWKVTPKFLKVEMDATGGTSFITMGTTRLQNVPFAYYANGVNANNIDGTVPVSKGGTGAINAAGARSNIGAESIANKSTDLLADATSTTKYPSVKTIKDYVDTKVASGNVSGTTIAILNGGTGASTASAALTNLGAESTVNKSTDITTDASSLTKYPSVKAIKDYVDTRVITGVSSSTDLNITSVNGLQLGLGNGTNNDENIAIGTDALKVNNIGYSNLAIGNNSLYSNTTGNTNMAIGLGALGYNQTGSSNTAIGQYSLSNNISDCNTAVGLLSMLANTTGASNTALGYNSLVLNTRGSYNTAIGTSSLFKNTLGNKNTAIGDSSQFNNLIGRNNTTIGSQSLLLNYLGNNNTAVGTISGKNNLEGNNNTFIGYKSDLLENIFVNNSTAIGSEAIVSASNSIQLGNNAITDVKTSGTITAAGYKTPTGTSTQFLMADGSVNANSANVNGFVHYVGELFGGGIIVSVWKEVDGEHGLIASKIDLSASAPIINSIINTTSTGSMTDGKSNTTAIVLQTGTFNCAAKICDDYVNSDDGTGVYSDWYLPAVLELELIDDSKFLINKRLSIADSFKLSNSYASSTMDTNTCNECVPVRTYNRFWHKVPFGSAPTFGNIDAISNYTYTVRAVRRF